MFWSFDERCAELRELGGDLERLKQVVDFELFRAELETVRHKDRKDNSGRKPFDVVLMFKILILQALYNLSDEQTEYQIKDRISFMNFLGLNLSDTVPDEKTIWLFRDQLRQRGLEQKLFKHFELHLRSAGLHARKGQIVDAAIMNVPKQRMSSEQRDEMKKGEVPPEFQQPAQRLAQKDLEARWTKKGGQTHYGYKNHISVDVEHKLIRAYVVTHAAEHDGNMLPQLLTENTNKDVYGDSAYRLQRNQDYLKEVGMRERMQRQARRGRPLTAREERTNWIRKKVRARVEHTFGRMRQLWHHGMLRAVGLARSAIKIGLLNLAYNLDRYAMLMTR